MSGAERSIAAASCQLVNKCSGSRVIRHVDTGRLECIPHSLSREMSRSTSSGRAERMRVDRKCDRPRRGRRRRSAHGTFTKLAQAARCRRVRSQKRKVAVADTRCKTPRLRPSAVRKRGSEVGEAKRVDALNDVGL
jgi:hypothetical protein